MLVAPRRWISRYDVLVPPCERLVDPHEKIIVDGADYNIGSPSIEASMTISTGSIVSTNSIG
jgi:hypothetical protein